MIQLILATVPLNKQMCQQVLRSIAAQTLKPDRIHLVLDGYGTLPAPTCDLPMNSYRTASLSGPGGRWRVLREFAQDDIVIVFDDDMNYSSDVVEKLVASVLAGGAAAAGGVTVTGRSPHTSQHELLISGGQGAKAMRVSDLAGFDALALEVRCKCGFDPLGDCGDDDALVGVCLWKNGVAIKYVHLPEVLSMPGMQRMQSQTSKRLARGEDLKRQRKEIARVTGWPWPLK